MIEISGGAPGSAASRRRPSRRTTGRRDRARTTPPTAARTAAPGAARRCRAARSRARPGRRCRRPGRWRARAGRRAAGRRRARTTRCPGRAGPRRPACRRRRGARSRCAVDEVVVPAEDRLADQHGDEDQAELAGGPAGQGGGDGQPGGGQQRLARVGGAQQQHRAELGQRAPAPAGAPRALRAASWRPPSPVARGAGGSAGRRVRRADGCRRTRPGSGLQPAAAAGPGRVLAPALDEAMPGSIDHAGAPTRGFGGLGRVIRPAAGTRPPHEPAFCQARIVPLTCTNAEGGGSGAC